MSYITEIRDRLLLLLPLYLPSKVNRYYNYINQGSTDVVLLSALFGINQNLCPSEVRKFWAQGHHRSHGTVRDTAANKDVFLFCAVSGYIY